MTDFFKQLTVREKEIVDFLISQINTNDGTYIYKVRELKEKLKIHHVTLSRTLEKIKKSGYFEVEDLGLRVGYKINLLSKFEEKEVLETEEKSIELEQTQKSAIKLNDNVNLEQGQKETSLISDIAPNEQTYLIGRNEEVKQILNEIKKRKDILVIGEIGTGKTAILKYIEKKLDSKNQNVIYSDYSKSFKQFLVNVVYNMHEKHKNIEIYEFSDKQEDTRDKEWKDLKRRITKMTVVDLAGLIKRSMKGQNYIIICDHMEMITPTAKAVFESMREDCCLVGATHTIKNNTHLKKLYWRFKHIEVKNLDLENAKKLIDYLYEKHNVNAYNKDVYKQRILKISNGNCSAIYDMFFHTSKEKYLSSQDIRDIKHHEAGTKELDLTPFLIFLGIGVVATRFIALGMNNKDVYILAGISGAVFMFVRYYLQKLSRK
jgi:nucleoside-triphosphatase THEP1